MRRSLGTPPFSGSSPMEKETGPFWSLQRDGENVWADGLGLLPTLPKTTGFPVPRTSGVGGSICDDDGRSREVPFVYWG